MAMCVGRGNVSLGIRLCIAEAGAKLIAQDEAIEAARLAAAAASVQTPDPDQAHHDPDPHPWDDLK